MASADDDVREIQLSGKQLVFLFMAVTVVSVVIFLCGVLVGRGVQPLRGTAVEVQAAPAVETAPDPTAPIDQPVAPANEPTRATGLGYQDDLEAKVPKTDKVTTAPPAPVKPVAPTSAAQANAATATPAAATSATSTKGSAPAPATPAKAAPAEATPSKMFPEPRGDGFAIQVAALTGKSEAEAVADRLKRKGYAVYVLSAPSGQPAAYKVRVGKFKARTEAEKIATRLEREEQFKPWITR